MKYLKDFNTLNEENTEKLSFFWDFVHKAKWKKDSDYERINKFLNKNYSLEEQKILKDTFDTYMDNLNSRFEDDWLANPGIEVSDDGWGDVRAEVIGRGKTYYDNVSVSKLQRMASRLEYTENFGYCFQN